MCPCRPPTVVGAAGPLSRDTAVSVTAAAMLAWFGQELAQQPTGKQQHSRAAAAAPAGTAGSQQAAAAGLGVPLATAGLQPAAAAASVPGGGSAQHGSEPAACGGGALSGPALAAAFQEWVTAAGDEANVDFQIKA